MSSDHEAKVTAVGQAGGDVAAVYEAINPDDYPPLPEPDDDDVPAA